MTTKAKGFSRIPMRHLTDSNIQKLLKAKEAAAVKGYLEALPEKEKGDVFEKLLAELYHGNGWLVDVKGGRSDKGADILLFHPKTPAKPSYIIQAKNHSKPLTFDQTKIELVKFEEQAAKKYDCSQFRIVAINGFVKEAQKLSRFNLSLKDWEHLAGLISKYDPEKITEPQIDLFPHNEATYQRIRELWTDTNKVAVVQATGTGKSFLIAKVMADFLNDKKLVMAPSKYILAQQKEKAPWASHSTTFMTYAKSPNLTKEKIKNLDAKLIVLDEFHRCGAEIWGQGVQGILDVYPEAYLLGTTATPIRYLDASRDMSDELFDNAVAEDFALFGQLYLNNGMAGGHEVVPSNWVRESLTISNDSRDSQRYPYTYLWRVMSDGSFFAKGILGQYIFVCPQKKLVIVRMGESEGNINWPEFFRFLTERL